VGGLFAGYLWIIIGGIMNGFTKEAWQGASPEIKNELLYGAIINLNGDIKTLHKWKYVNTAVTALFSFAGGMTAILMLANNLI
jgi:hypothetical protein